MFKGRSKGRQTATLCRFVDQNEEAVKDFGSRKDFTIWAWYANRIGVNSFLEIYFEQKSVMKTCTLRNPAAAFHMRLKRFYAALKEGGAL